MGTDLIKRALGIHVDVAYCIEMVHTHCLDLKNRHVWLHGTPIQLTTADDAGPEAMIEYMNASKFIKNLHLLMMQSESEPVLIHLHTCGGIWEEGMAIYDAIRSMPNQVTIVNHTHARSMSSVILQAADIRIMMPNSCFMFHQGQMGAEAEAKTFYSISDWYRRTDNIMTGIYAEKVRAGNKFRSKSIKQIVSIIKRAMDKRGDVFLTAEEAIDWGFADHIFTSWKDVAKIRANS